MMYDSWGSMTNPAGSHLKKPKHSKCNNCIIFMQIINGTLKCKGTVRSPRGGIRNFVMGTMQNIGFCNISLRLKRWWYHLLARETLVKNTVDFDILIGSKCVTYVILSMYVQDQISKIVSSAGLITGRTHFRMTSFSKTSSLQEPAPRTHRGGQVVWARYTFLILFYGRYIYYSWCAVARKCFSSPKIFLDAVLSVNIYL